MTFPLGRKGCKDPGPAAPPSPSAQQQDMKQLGMALQRPALTSSASAPHSLAPLLLKLNPFLGISDLTFFRFNGNLEESVR